MIYMKEVFINNSMNLIHKYYPDYSEEKLAELKYGLLGLYLLITKSIIIFGIAIFLGIFKEHLIFMIIYNILRAPSFGVHASKSSICLVLSAIIFILSTYISIYLSIPINIKILIGIVGIIFICKYSPADTKKKPILSLKRRRIYKTLSTVIAIIFTICSLLITNNFLANAFLFALVIQCIFISPITYRIFGEPYDNYKSYQP